MLNYPRVTSHHAWGFNDDQPLPWKIPKRLGRASGSAAPATLCVPKNTLKDSKQLGFGISYKLLIIEDIAMENHHFSLTFH